MTDTCQVSEIFSRDIRYFFRYNKVKKYITKSINYALLIIADEGINSQVFNKTNLIKLN